MRSLAVFLIGAWLGLWLRQRARTPGPSLNLRDGARRAGQADPLTEITGIGPVYEQALYEIGVMTFDALAREDPDQLAARLENRVSGERIRREQWIEQARERARI